MVIQDLLCPRVTGKGMQLGLEYHPYKIFIGKSELSGQEMDGFEN